MEGLQTVIQICISGVLIGCVYALIAWSFTIVFNATGIVNFAAGEFVMMGGVISASLNSRLGWSPVLSVPLSVIIVAFIAGAIDRWCLQKARSNANLTLVMLTIGLGIVLRGAMLFSAGKDFEFPPSFSSGDGPSFWGISIPAQGTWIIGCAIVVTALLWLVFSRSWMGRAMRAVGENARAAELMGIAPADISTIAFAMSGAMGALAGALIAPIASANYTTGLFFGLKGFSAAVLGGLGSPTGAVAGGILLGLLENLSAGYLSSGWKDGIALCLLILVLLIKPTGLFGRKNAGRV